MNLTAIIIEDEINARDELEFLLQDYSEIKIIQKCANAIEGIKAINNLLPDVIFLDIQLPLINGFEMLSMIEESKLPRVVFITAYDEYAIEAFNKDAIDYLLKPIEKDRLQKTIEKLKRIIQNNEPQKININQLNRIPVLSGTHKIKLLDVDLVEYVYSDEFGVFLFSNENKKYYTELTLKVLESKTKLYRCHKQYLINLDMIDEIIFEENSSAKIQTKNNHYIPVSRHYLKELKESLGL